MNTRKGESNNNNLLTKNMQNKEEDKMEFLKKEQYERKLKRRYFCQVAGVYVILIPVVLELIIMCIGMDRFTNQRVTIWARPATCVGIISVIWMIAWLTEELKESYKERLSDFEFNLKEEEFFHYLGDRRIELKLRLKLKWASKKFKDTVRNPKIEWYVEKHGQDELYLRAFEGKEEVFHSTTDYGFLRRYFKEKVEHSLVIDDKSTKQEEKK